MLFALLVYHIIVKTPIFLYDFINHKGYTHSDAISIHLLYQIEEKCYNKML